MSWLWYFICQIHKRDESNSEHINFWGWLWHDQTLFILQLHLAKKWNVSNFVVFYAKSNIAHWRFFWSIWSIFFIRTNFTIKTAKQSCYWQRDFGFGSSYIFFIHSNFSFEPDVSWHTFRYLNLSTISHFTFLQLQHWKHMYEHDSGFSMYESFMLPLLIKSYYIGKVLKLC